MADVQLEYAVPSADLAEHVSLFYYFRAETPAFSDSERADRAQLRFMLRGHGDYQLPDGHIQSAPETHLAGPTTGPRKIIARGPLALFGIGIRPAGWAAIVGTSAAGLTNRLVDAVDLFGARMNEARAALAAAPDLAAMVPIAEALIRLLIHAGGGATLAFVRHVDEWLSAAPSPELETLIATTGLSRRQIERKCNSLYGMPPKLLARKYRALRAAVALLVNGESLNDVIDRGFYDQSHLIREIKQFTGLTPHQMKSEPNLLSQLSIVQRQALAGKTGPLVSDA